MNPKSPFRGENKTFIIQLPASGTTGGTFGATLIYTLDKNETTNLSGHPKKEELTITVASKIRNADWVNFCNNYIQQVNAESFTQEYEDGTKDTITGIPSGTKLVGVIHVDAKLNGQRIVTSFIGVPSGETGSFNTATNSLGDTPIEIKAVSSPYAFAFDLAGFYLLANDVLATITTIALGVTVGEYGKRLLWTSA